MKRFIFFSLLVIFSIGCAHLPKSQDLILTREQEKVKVEESVIPDQVSVEPQDISEEAIEEEDIEMVTSGLSFGKTDFQGVLKTSYVRLSIIDRSDAKKVYHLYIGDKPSHKTFLWQGKTVEPGYFFIDLPQGEYKINAIAIPVGSAMAVEAADMDFSVELDSITYLGTLSVTGTKEKVRLGGVPVIKPGFEYTVQILDERDEAVEELLTRLPHNERKINFSLIQIRSDTD